MDLLRHLEPRRTRPPVAIPTLVAALGLLYVATITAFVGGVFTSGCLLECGPPAPLLGAGTTGVAAGLATAAAALATWLVSPAAARGRIGAAGWRDLGTTVWGAVTLWAGAAAGPRLGPVGIGVTVVAALVGSWRAAPALSALRRGRDPTDEVPLHHHLPTWARRSLRTLSVLLCVWLLVLVWSVWTHRAHFRVEEPLGADAGLFLLAGLVLPVATWVMTSPEVTRWVRVGLASASVAALPGAVVLLSG